VLDFGCGTGLLTEKVQSQVSNAISIDVAPSMIKVLQEKTKSGGWDNVEAYCVVAAHVGQAAPETKAALEAWKGKVDIVAFSSVLSFVPEGDLKATMKFLCHMLKPGTGMLMHSDWPKGEDQPDGFAKEKALAMHGMGGLQAKTTKTITMKTGGYDMPVFLGVATKTSLINDSSSPSNRPNKGRNTVNKCLRKKLSYSGVSQKKQLLLHTHSKVMSLALPWKWLHV